MDWRLTNADSDFDQWRLCPKCRGELVLPKTLPCLHTSCATCLSLHNKLETQRFKARYPDTDIEKYSMPCPICSFPCRLTSGPDDLLTNEWLLQLAYREREAWWREFALSKETWTKSFPVLGKITNQSAGKNKSEVKAKPIKNEEEVALIQDDVLVQEEAVSSGTFVTHETAQGEGGMNESQGETSEVVGEITEGQGATSEVLGETTEGQGTTANQGETAAVVVKKSFLTEQPDDSFHWPWENELGPEIKSIVRRLLIDHLKSLDHQFIDPLDREEAVVPGSGSLRHLFNFDLSFGSEPSECFRSCAFAVNKATGNIMVVDNSLCKCVFFDENGRFFGHKNFRHPVMDCSFLPMKSEFPVERFCAMGKKKGNYDSPALLFVGPVNKDPDTFQISEQDKLGDISGFHCVDGVYYISMGNENKSIWRYSERTYKEISTANLLQYPTHITNGLNGEIIIADSGNHRIAVFSGHNYDDVRFIGQYGHKDGEMFWPLGVAVDKMGRLFVCDANNYRVQVFNAEYRFESVPIRHTFRLTPSVAQDVKPLDCAIDCHQRVLVLFRGKSFCSLQCFAYEHPTWCVYPLDDPPPSSFAWSSLCCCNRNARSRSDYERI